MGLVQTEPERMSGIWVFFLLSSRKEHTEEEYSPLPYDVFDCDAILDHRRQAKNDLAFRDCVL